MAFPTVSWRHTEVLVADVVALGPGAWGRASFLVLLRSALLLPRINDADHPLGTGMDMNVSDFNGLIVATPVPVEHLDQLELKPEQSSSIPTIDADERFIEMLLTVRKELKAGEARDGDLNSDQRFEFTLRLNGGDQRDCCV
jgi:hypothetical protein